MELLQRLFGRPRPEPADGLRAMVAAEVRDAADPADTLVELHIVGESYRQDALAAISGPKHAEGKHFAVGATLRCEPTNPHDSHAVRVEVMGRHVAYVARDQATILCPAMMAHCRGVLEGPAMIVGGWHNGDSEGSYGIRVWITSRDAARLALRPDQLDPRLRQYPTLPPVRDGERRLAPPPSDPHPWVTVTCEEYYQPALLAATPHGWDDHSWPLLVDLTIAPCNPHSSHDGPCIRVSIGEEAVGFFTPKMTERYLTLVEEALTVGGRVTAEAWVHQGTKHGDTFWRVRLSMPNVPHSD